MSTTIDETHSHNHCSTCPDHAEKHAVQGSSERIQWKNFFTDTSTSKFDKFMYLMEKVSAVALGAFAAFTSIELFIPFCLVGLALGLYSFFEVSSNHTSNGHSAACSHGFIESLTGIHLPAPISLAANIAITICHIDHHNTVFVPIVGLFIGSWAGKGLAECGELLVRKFVPIRNGAF